MLLSDFYPDRSDITSLDDDDEFIIAQSQGPSLSSGQPKPERQRSPNTQDYTIVSSLRPPRPTSYSVRALYGPSFLLIPIVPLTLSSDQIIDGSIKLDLDYQRGTMNPVVFLVRS